jgi:hypothetical protein
MPRAHGHDAEQGRAANEEVVAAGQGGVRQAARARPTAASIPPVTNVYGGSPAGTDPGARWVRTTSGRPGTGPRPAPGLRHVVGPAPGDDRARPGDPLIEELRAGPGHREGGAESAGDITRRQPVMQSCRTSVFSRDEPIERHRQRRPDHAHSSFSKPTGPGFLVPGDEGEPRKSPEQTRERPLKRTNQRGEGEVVADVAARPAPRQHSQSVLGMLIDPRQGFATRSGAGSSSSEAANNREQRTLRISGSHQYCGTAEGLPSQPVQPASAGTSRRLTPRGLGCRLAVGRIVGVDVLRLHGGED